MTNTLDAAPETQISRLTVPEIDDLPDDLQRQIRSIERQLGYIPNWVRAFALGGAHAARFNEYILGLLDPNAGLLPYADRELIATVSSAENGCSYCRLNHAVSLGDALGDKKLGTRIAVDYREVRELTARQRTLADFAGTLSVRPGEVSDDDLDALRDLGLDDAAIYEAIQVVAAFAAANRISIALQVRPDDQFFD
ncbi:peroxidase-related enzyme [Gordonia sputi]|mgnify:FL=1